MISLKLSLLNLHLTIQSMKSNLKIQIRRPQMKRRKKNNQHKKKQRKRVKKISLEKFYLIQRTIRVHQNQESRQIIQLTQIKTKKVKFHMKEKREQKDQKMEMNQLQIIQKGKHKIPMKREGKRHLQTVEIQQGKLIIIKRIIQQNQDLLKSHHQKNTMTQSLNPKIQIHIKTRLLPKKQNLETLI